ncbi:hypothetical protein ACFO5K_03320 [Nocardia halotolerans]|uniref:Uncharacterized protein n=1 Tax=Nocardia halotolerans TaxID=1755878 RepID=A0ABV8VCZ2_9NOCA
MADPTIEQLSESVTTAGADWGAEIGRGPHGRLQIIRRHGELLHMPVVFAVTDAELRAYYRRIAGEAERGVAPEPAWEWWMTLMSTHLAEALHELDRDKRPCVVIVGDTGFAAAPVDSDD